MRAGPAGRPRPFSMEQWEVIINAALRDFLSAISEMLAPTEPATPLPRPRVFELAPGVWWPNYKGKADVDDWYVISFDNPPTSFGRRLWAGGGQVYSVTYYGSSKDAAEFFLEKCRFQPRLALRTLRRIQAASAWCRARAEGRRRMAEEILRQQAGAVEALEAEEVLLGLKRI